MKESQPNESIIKALPSKRAKGWGEWVLVAVGLLVVALINAPVLVDTWRIDESNDAKRVVLAEQEALLEAMVTAQRSEFSNETLLQHIYRGLSLEELPSLESPHVLVGKPLERGLVSEVVFWVPEGDSEITLNLRMNYPYREDGEEKIAMRRRWTLPLIGNSWYSLGVVGSDVKNKRKLNDPQLILRSQSKEFAPLKYLLPRNFEYDGQTGIRWVSSKFLPNQTGQFFRPPGKLSLEGSFYRSYRKLNPLAEMFILGKSGDEKAELLLSANLNFAGPCCTTARGAKGIFAGEIAADDPVARSPTGRYLFPEEFSPQSNQEPAVKFCRSDGDNDLSFLSCFPTQYSTAQNELPLLILLGSDRETTTIPQPFVDAAEANQWIVVNCNRFKEDLDKELADVMFTELLTAIESQVNYDNDRVYLGGIGAGAKHAIALSERSDRPWAGGLTCGAYSPPAASLPSEMPLAIIRSKNKQILEPESKPDLNSDRTNIKFYTFHENGNRQVPPSEVLAEAIEWIVYGEYKPRVIKKYPMPQVGAVPPEISAESWINCDEAPTLKSLRGAVVLLDFFSCRNPESVFGMKQRDQLQDDLLGDGLVILGFNDDLGTEIDKFLEKRLGYRVGLNSKLADKYGVSKLPYSFLIGRDGKVVWRGVTSDKELEAQLQAALKKSANGADD